MGYGVVVVVSAMGDATDQLLQIAFQITPNPSARELDMLLSTGERATMALLSIAIQKYGAQSISFTGSQSGIITNDSHACARIIAVRPYRIQDELERGKIVIVAGFQGTSYRNEITTLGRGGSDMTAIALAGALNAEACEIYSDVDGVYSADPKVVLDAVKLDELSADAMLTMAQHGAKVLHDEAVAYALRHGIALYAKKSHQPDSTGTLIRPDGWPEHALKASKNRPTAVVTAKYILYLSARDVDITTCLARLTGIDGLKIIDCVCGHRQLELIADIWNCRDFSGIRAALLENSAPGSFCRDDVLNVTLTGIDIGRDPNGLHHALTCLKNDGITPVAIFCQPNAISFVVNSSDCSKASGILHELTR